MHSCNIIIFLQSTSITGWEETGIQQSIFNSLMACDSMLGYTVHHAADPLQNKYTVKKFNHICRLSQLHQSDISLSEVEGMLLK